jgi:AraC-like DNA-binding protein
LRSAARRLSDRRAASSRGAAITETPTSAAQTRLRAFLSRQSRRGDDQALEARRAHVQAPLHRRDRTHPIAYVQRLRIEDAKRRLERTDEPVDEVSWRVGYEDPAFFRRLFKRITGLAPGAYRRPLRIPDFARP